MATLIHYIRTVLQLHVTRDSEANLALFTTAASQGSVFLSC